MTILPQGLSPAGVCAKQYISVITVSLFPLQEQSDCLILRNLLKYQQSSAAGGVRGFVPMWSMYM